MANDPKIDINLLEELSKDEMKMSTGQFDFFRLKHVFFKSRVLICVLLIISLTIGYLFLRYTPNVYESTARLKINFKSESGILGIQSNINAPGQKGSSLQGEIEIIRSSVIFQEVIDKLDINVSYFVEGQILSEEKYRSSPFKILYNKSISQVPYDRKINLRIIDQNTFEYGFEEGPKTRSKFGEKIQLKLFEFQVLKTAGFNKSSIGPNFFFKINSNGYLLNYMRTNLSVQIENNEASTVSVRFKDYNKYKAQSIVDKFVQVYLSKTLEKKKESHRKTLEYINKQISHTKEKLDYADKLLRDFIRNSSTFDAKSEFPRLKEKKNQLEQQLAEKLNELEGLDKLYRSLEEQDSISFFLSGVRNNSNPEIVKLSNELGQLYKEFESLKLTSKPNTFLYQKKELELLRLKNNILQFILSERNLLVDNVMKLKNKIEDVQTETYGIPARDSEQRRLERDYQLFEKFYTLFYTKRIEYEIMKAGTIQEFDVLSEASLPGESIYPVRIFVYGLALFGWLFITIGWLVLQYLMQNKIVNQADLERSISAPLLGSVPKHNKEKMEMSQLVVGNYPKSILSEAFRSIRTNLDFLVPSKDSKHISVTSTVSGEGKTFIALNLGGVLAMSGKKVIILDLDMRKPKIHHGLGSSNLDGMSNILIGKSSYQSCIQKSSIEGLDFITAGPIPPNPSELLLRPDFDELLKELDKSYDIVLLDSPPVGLVTDGIILQRKVDASIYVVRSDYSRKGVEKSINKLIHFNKIKNLSVILNAVSKHSSNQYGYGGYGYGYGYGYYDDESKLGKNIFSKLFKRKK